MKLTLFIFSLILSLNLIAQSDWKDINPPVNVVNYGSTNFKYHVDNEGRLNCAFIYNDGSNDILQVDQYNNLSASWSNLYFETLSLGSGELKSDKDQQGNLVFTFVSNQEISPKINMYSIAGNTVTQKFTADFNNYNPHANYGFRTFNSTEFYWFFPDSSGINYRIGYWQTATSTINDFVIGEFTGMDMQDFHLELLGDTLWIASGDLNTDRLQLMKSHKNDINFLAHDGTSLGELYNGIHPVKLSTASLISNRFDKLSVLSIDTTANRVEIQFTNGVKSNKAISGDYYSNAHKYSNSNGLNEAYLITNFGQSLDFSGSNTKVLEKDYTTDTWEIVGQAGNQLFEIDQLSPANFDVFKNSASERISAAYSFFSFHKIKILNEAPFIDSLVLTPRATLCPHTSQVQLFSKFTLWDVNGDMLKITDITSSNQAVLADSNINYYSSFQTGKTQHFEVNSYQATAGTTTLTFYVTDGFDTISFTKDLTFTSYSISSVTNGTNCGNGQVTLGANSSSGAGDYFWFDVPTGGTQLSFGASFVTPTLFSTTTYYVEATDNGCFANRVPVTAQIFPLPNVDAGAELTICLNSQAVLTATGAASYTWTNGVLNGVPFNPTFNDTYFVTGTDANGCQNTDQVNVIVNTPPTVDAGFDQTYCGNTSITLSGTGAQSYMWSDGLLDNIPFSISNTTTFTLTGTDANGCVATDQIVVTINPIPTVHAGNDTTLCEMAEINLFGSGADSYDWDNSVFNGASFSPPVGSTTYTVTGTDLNGCTDTDQITITVNALPTINAGSDITICENGLVTLSGSGGVNYSWDNGVSDGISFIPASSGTYSVIGTDANGCQNSDQVDVSVNALPVVDAGADITVCQGQFAMLEASGAASYIWDNAGLQSASFVPSTSATYTVTGTDANGCQNTDQLVLTVNSLPIVGAGNDTTLCETASISLFGSGAESYDWDNSVFNGAYFAPPVGSTTYTVTGTALNGCTDTDQITITVNSLPTINAGSDITICQNDLVTLSASGGVNYAWDNGVSDGISFVPASSGTYSVIGTDANGCQNTDQLEVIINALPVVDAGIDIFVCQGDSTVLIASGANSYNWDNGGIQTAYFTPTLSKTYTVTGTDVNGCQNTDQLLLTVNTLPIVNAGNDTTLCETASISLFGSGADSYDWDNSVFNGAPFSPAVGTTTFTVTGTDINGCKNTDQVNVTVNSLPTINAGSDITICQNDPVTLSGSGGVNYSWDNSVSDGISFNPTLTRTYTLIGTDANGCQNTDQVDINVNALPSVSAGFDITVCENDMVTNSAFGALTYVWDNGVTDNVPFAALPGVITYTVSGTDANGCVGSDSKVVTVNALPNISAGADQIVCEGTLVTLTSTGAISLDWDNGAFENSPFFSSIGTVTYTVTGSDANGCTNSDQVDVTVYALPIVDAGADIAVCENAQLTLSGAGASIYVWDNGVADGVSFIPAASGTYTLTGTDANGCENTDQVDVVVNPLPTIDGGVDISVCSGFSIVLAATGATSYTWDNGGVQNESFIPSGSVLYTVVGTDDNGCQNSDQVDVVVNALPTVNAGNDISVCQNETITLAGSGTAISYAWDNGVTDNVGFPAVGTTTYSVLGTDVNGCQASDDVIVTVNFAPGITSNSPVEICENDVVNVSLSTGASIIRWFDAITGGNLLFEGRNYNPSLSSNTTFYVDASDGICTSMRIPVDVIVNSRPQVQISTANTDCGTANGTASAIISQGTAPFTHYWSSGNQNTLNISNLASGIYYFNVEDAKACKTIAAAEIFPTNVSINGTSTDVSCFGGNNGAITTSVNGITETFSYLWSNGYQSADISNLTAGTYELTIRTNSGCDFSKTFTVSEAPKLELEVSQIQPSCGNSDGELSVTSISGGTPTFAYNWSSGGSTNTLSNIPFGVYTLTITDGNNCLSDHVYYLSESNSAGIFGTVIPASCNTSNGSIDALLTPQIGDVVTDISWSNGETTEDIFDLAIGNYVCTATTSNLCKSIRGWNIKTQKPLTQEICIVSVDSTTTTNLVVWEKAQTSGVSHYNIYRETNTADEYLLIDTVQFSNLSVFNDVIASPVARSWRYKISAVDLCGAESDLSFPHKTLHLNTFDLGQNQVKVTWDQYEGNAFSSYALWRFTDAAGWVEVASLPTNSLSFTDNIAISAPGLDYMVEISLDEPCTATLWRAQDFNRSRSNKEKSIFNPGSGTGDYSNNSIFEYAGNGINIQLYPNPFDEELNIDFKGITSLDIQLYGASGKLIQEFSYQEGVNNMNLSHLSNGVYYLKASKNNFETTIKIIKH